MSRPSTALFEDLFACHMSSAVVSVCSEKNPCKNGGHCVDVASEEELKNVGVKNGGKSRHIVVHKYSVSRCICRYGFSGQLCQHGKYLLYLVWRRQHVDLSVSTDSVIIV